MSVCIGCTTFEKSFLKILKETRNIPGFARGLCNLSSRVDMNIACAVNDSLKKFVSAWQSANNQAIKQSCTELKKIVIAKRLIIAFTEVCDLEGIQTTWKIVKYHLSDQDLKSISKLYYEKSGGRNIRNDLTIKVKKGHTFKEVLDKMHALNIRFAKEFISTEGIKYEFSYPFKVSKIFQDRPISLFLVKFNKRNYLRLCYLSNSQSVWRITNKMFPDWISKSDMGENATCLPIEANMQLFELYKPEKIIEVDFLGFKELLPCAISVSKHDTGTLAIKEIEGKSYFKLEDGELTELAASSLEGGDYRFVRLVKKATGGRMNDDKTLPPKKPEENDLSHEEFQPRTCTFSKEVDNPLYGRLTATVFASKDQGLNYLFMQQKSSKQIFLAMAEIKKSQISKHGIRKKYPELKGLDLPLLEYEAQFDKSHISEKNREGNYVRTWEYLKCMPLIAAVSHYLRNASK